MIDGESLGTTVQSRGAAGASYMRDEGRAVPDADASSQAVGALAALWVVALVAAGLGLAILYDARPGINWGIWTTVAGGALVVFAGRSGRRVDPVAWWAVALALLVSWGAAVTADGEFQFFISVTCIVLLAVATRVVGGWPSARVGAVQMALAPPVALGYAVIEAGRRSAESMAGLRADRSVPVVRGLALAAPVVLLFAWILAGADPVLAGWREAVVAAIKNIELWPRLMFFVGLGVVVLGACGLAARGSGAGRVTEASGFGVPVWRVGATERRIIVGGTAGVFGLFLAVQPSYLFRNTDTMRVSGVSYTEYAHRGFSELTIAATLCVLLVLALDRYAPGAGEGQSGGGVRAERASWWRHWGTLLLVAEVLVVLSSAFYRVTVYEAAYGYTTLRVYVQAYVVGVGVTLVLLAAEVAGVGVGVGVGGGLSGAARAFDGRRAARRSAAVAALMVAAFSFGNPEGWVATHNIARYRATGKLDGSYLATNLSLNAMPAMVALIPTLPPSCSATMRVWLSNRYGYQVMQPVWSPAPWFEWNLRRERGLAALRSAGIGVSREAGVPRGSECDLGGF